MTNFRTSVALAILGYAALMIAGPAMASDADVLACRATQNARVFAGKCGGHGCDCGLLRSECGASKRYLESFDREGRESAAYTREAYAFAHACGKGAAR
jgi:hypothetical protein